MNDDFQDGPDLKEHLWPGEKLLWSGQPARGLKLRPSDAATIPFSLMWAGFAFVWETGVIVGNAPFWFRIWGVPFVIIGLYLVIGRFFLDAWLRARTVYGVSNQRILIFSARSKALTSLPLLTLSEFTITERSDGLGTIKFGPAQPAVAPGRPPRNSLGESPAFEFIPEVQYVSSAIHAAQMNARPAAE
jgi:hypothetical protein